MDSDVAVAALADTNLSCNYMKVALNLSSLNRLLHVWSTYLRVLLAVAHVRYLFCSPQGYKAHCGFPERAFGRFSNALLEQGYKCVLSKLC